MSGREVAPLKTPEEFLGFKKPLPCAVEPLKDVKRDEPKILFCLDMTGGSQDDRFINGHDKSVSYRFHHWQLINSFVYCSHHLVTIPPPGWVSTGHKHGVKVLESSSWHSSDSGLCNQHPPVWLPHWQFLRRQTSTSTRPQSGLKGFRSSTTTNTPQV
ncbi:hypothetical protein V5799_010710 [Amblyomma americanum]|uniref:Cytosolic endo-beta-N-acetylglucosaminidase TIM barrel domain-containing protein n=1 Tax=Amblyomma americanum TaxID=6943 RepID=A0AAQ4EIX8_AMBAM